MAVSAFSATTIAVDTASNYGAAWSGNGGSGLDSWVFRNNGGGGEFLANTTANTDLNYIWSNPDYKGWGTWANGGGVQYMAAFRGFGWTGTSWGNALDQSGDQFKVSMENGSIQSGGNCGFVLRNGNTDTDYDSYNSGARFELGFVGGDSNYSIWDNAGKRDTGIAWTHEGLDVVFEMTGANTYTATVYWANGGSEAGGMEGTLSGSGTIDSVALYNRDTEDANVYFNKLEIIDAAGLVVMSSHDDDGSGTLRYILENNASSGDTVTFDSGVTHITLTQDELSISQSQTIDGGGTVTINGGGTNRIFDLSGTPRTWAFLGLELTNGVAQGAGDNGKGGAIRIMSDSHANMLTISNCSISACAADVNGGGLYAHSGSASGSIVVRDSVIHGNTAVSWGGGVFSYTAMSLYDTVVSNNASGDAGGVYLEEPQRTSVWDNATIIDNSATNGHGGACYYRDVVLAVSDSSFKANSATENGGALSFYYFLSASSSNDVVFTNCSFTANTATNSGQHGGAVYVGSGIANFNGCTFANNEAAGNGGAIYVYFSNDPWLDGTCILRDCDVYGNQATDGGAVHREFRGAVFTALDNTRIHDNTASSDGGGVSVATPNGDISYLTIRDSSIYGNTATDFGGGIVTYDVMTLENVVISNNTASVGGAIYGNEDESTSTWDNVTFVDNEATGNDGGGALHLRSMVVGINNSTFAGNIATLKGGGLVTAGIGAFHGAPVCNVTISNCTFSSNRINLAYAYNHDGGGIYVGGANGDRDIVALIDSTIVSNRCGDQGGGIFNNGYCNITNCDIYANEARRYGGGVQNHAGFLTIDGSRIYNNTTLDSGSYGGGGLATSTYDPTDGTATIRDTVIYGNSSAAPGGGIKNYQKLTMTDCVVSNNSTANGDHGGGVWVYSSSTAFTSTFSNVTFTDNSATLSGGGLYVERAQVEVAGSTFAGNQATDRGGAVFLESYGSPGVLISNTTFRSNVANKNSYYTPAGGAILTSQEMTIDSCTFVSNRAPNGPGGAMGILGSGANVTIKNSTFSGNKVERTPATQETGGGALFVYSSATLNMYNSAVYTNTAVERGGGIMQRDNSSGSLSIYSSIIAGNDAPSGADMSSWGGGDFDLDHCIYQDGTGWTAGTLADNITGDPLLDPLADNGGPTLTHALQSGSPCKDAGTNPLSLACDQRGPGYDRVSGDAADIGPYEYPVATGSVLKFR